MYYLTKMNVEYIHHLIKHENIKVELSKMNNKKKLIQILINHYNNKHSKNLLLVM